MIKTFGNGLVKRVIALNVACVMTCSILTMRVYAGSSVATGALGVEASAGESSSGDSIAEDSIYDGTLDSTNDSSDIDSDSISDNSSDIKSDSNSANSSDISSDNSFNNSSNNTSDNSLNNSSNNTSDNSFNNNSNNSSNESSNEVPDTNIDSDSDNGAANDSSQSDPLIQDDDEYDVEYAVLLDAGQGEFNDGNNENTVYVFYDKPYGSCHRYLIIEEYCDEDNDKNDNEKNDNNENDNNEFDNNEYGKDDQGIKEGTPDKYTYVEEYNELPIPMLEGYKFLGWSTQQDIMEDNIITEDEEQFFVSSEDKVKTAKDHILYAIWSKLDTVTIEQDRSDNKSDNILDNISDNAPDDTSLSDIEAATDLQDSDLNNNDSSGNNIDADPHKETDKESDKENNLDEDIDPEQVTSTDTTQSDSLPSEVTSDLDEDDPALLSKASTLTYDSESSRASSRAYTVIFKLQGGDFSVTDSVVFTVDHGDTIPRPEDPTRTKYNFKGWYTSPDGDEEYDFASPIVSDTYIYARWDALYKASEPTVSVYRSRTDNSTGNTVAEDARILLSSASYDARIYYIVNPKSDKQIPSQNDLLYTDSLVAGKLEEGGSVTIRAIAVKEGYEDSDVVSFTFNVLSDSDNWGELTYEDRALYDDPNGIPDGMWVAGVKDKTYIGSAITFSPNEIRVYDGKKLLVAGTDYSVSYKNNTNAGTATVVVSGKNNYTGNIKKTFEIYPRNISSDSFNTSDIVLQYTGEVQNGKTSLVYNNGSRNITLKEGTDFEYSYPEYMEQDDNLAYVGCEDEDRQYVVTISGIGNYTGTRTFTETIVASYKTMISNASVSIPSAKYADHDENGYVCPLPVLKYDGEVLVGYTSDSYELLSDLEKENVDYTYYYTDNDHAGKGYVVLEGRGRFAGFATASFTIKGVALSSAKMSGFTDSFIYNGKEQKQVNVTLNYNGDLIEGRDYLVTYEGDTTNAGTVTVTYAGIGGFTGKIKKTYEITPYDLAQDATAAHHKISISVLDDDGDNTFAYVKSGVTPLPVVMFEGAALTPDCDYSVGYSNNTVVNGSKTPTVTVTGLGNFTGSVNTYFYIEDKNMSPGGVSLEADDKVYANKKGNYKTAYVLADSNGKLLTAGTDYERDVVYSYAEDTILYDGTYKRSGEIASDTDIVSAGTIMRITARGKGYYKGEISGTYRVVAGDVFKASVRVYTQYYEGDEVRPDKSQIEVKLGGVILSPEDYEIVSYADNSCQGTAKLTIKGIGDYGGTKTVSFTIAARSMSYVIIYNGNGSTSGSVNNQTLAAGKFAMLSNNKYVRTGFEFTGWNTESDGSGVQYQNKEMIVNDGTRAGVNLILYAQWEPMRYNITYHLNGGANNAANSKVSYTASDPTFPIYTPDREDWAEGYQFGGWYLDNSYKNKITEIRRGSLGDIDLYAKWIPYTYTVHFDGNGATKGEVTDETFSYGVFKKLNPNRYEKNGFAFTGWALTREDADNNIVFAADNENVADLVARRNNVNGEITLYAVWRDSFEIVYNLAGGRFDTDKVMYEYKYGTTYLLPVPIRDGYSFEGWFKEDNTGSETQSKVTSVSDKLCEDLYLYAKWKPYSYTIKYDGNGSDEGSSHFQELIFGSVSKLDEVSFARKGYRFTGWNTLKNPTTSDPGISFADMEEVNILPTKDGDNITLYAQWEVTEYSIHYELNGGSFDKNTDNYISRYEYGHEGGYELPVPKKKGFTFCGWYIDDGFKNRIDVISQSTWKDLTLYALWDTTFTVVFDPNIVQGDVVTGTIKDQKIKYNTTTILRSNAYQSDNYLFMGWALSKTDADNGIIAYANRQKILRPSDDHLVYDTTTGIYTMRLYAVWRNSFRVTYVLNGGDFVNGEVPVTEYLYNSLTNYDLVSPVRDGYTFDGWYTEAGYWHKITSIAPGSTGDKTLYAKWKSKKYKVNFIADPPADKKVTGKMGSQTLQYGIDKKLTKNAYKISGYTMAGWSMSCAAQRKEDDLILTDAQVVNGILDTYTDVIDLYAVWIRDTYPIVYNNVAGLDNSMNPDSYNVDDHIVLEEPQAIGNTFLGWYSDENFRTKVTVLRSGTTGPVQLYAKWEIMQYTIRYDLNAGDDTSAILDTKNVGYITSYRDKEDRGYRLATASRRGYAFKGWYEEESCENAVGQTIENPYVDMTVYAKWNPNSYKITYYLNEGTLPEDAPMGYLYGDSFELPVPDRDNYTFLGWYIDEEFTESYKMSSISATTIGNITLYAKWKLNVIDGNVTPDDYISLAEFGGYPDDGLSDTRAIQEAIKKASGNASNGGVNTVYLPAGVYNITDIGNYDHGIELKSNVNLIMDKDAILKVAGMSYGSYEILSLRYLSNVTIKGGKLLGERYDHSGYYGESGHGIAMHGCSNIAISNMYISANWGDGVYFGTQAVRQSDGSQAHYGNTGVVISGCDIYDNRRNAISLTDADNITIEGCMLHDSHGTAPQCCVYIEPNADSSDKVCEHILIKDTVMTAYQNKDDDLYMVFMTHYDPYNLSYVTARDVRFIGCEFNGFFGNYSGLDVTFESTSFNGTVVNLKAGN